MFGFLVLGACLMSSSRVEPESACRVTVPPTPAPAIPDEVNRVFHGPDGIVGSGDLWVILPAPRSAAPHGNGGSFGQKIAWYRTAEGRLVITGKRLDGPGTMVAEIPAGYGQTGAQPTLLVVSSLGCWEITGILKASSLSFVIDIQRFMGPPGHGATRPT